MEEKKKMGGVGVSLFLILTLLAHGIRHILPVCCILVWPVRGARTLSRRLFVQPAEIDAHPIPFLLLHKR